MDHAVVTPVPVLRWDDESSNWVDPNQRRQAVEQDASWLDPDALCLEGVARGDWSSRSSSPRATEPDARRLAAELESLPEVVRRRGELGRFVRWRVR